MKKEKIARRLILERVVSSEHGVKAYLHALARLEEMGVGCTHALHLELQVRIAS